MNQMIETVLRNTSPAEASKIRGGSVETAIWIANKVLDVTPTQAESVGIRVMQHLCLYSHTHKMPK